MAIIPNHRDTEEDALGYLLREKWQRKGGKLVTTDSLLREAVDLHFAELGQEMRDRIGFATVRASHGGRKLVLDSAKAQSFFEERGTALAIEAELKLSR